MGLAEDLKEIVELFKSSEQLVKSTEQATRTYLVHRFLQALGYDPTHPDDVVPEFIADVGEKKGEKIDFAVFGQGSSGQRQLRILVECKVARVELCKEYTTQLFRYFGTQDVKLGILTNGLDYFFYTDRIRTNRMDEHPFLKVALDGLDDHTVALLRKLAKESFNLEAFVAEADQLSWERKIKKHLWEQVKEPSEEFVRLFFDKVQPPRSRFTGQKKEQFTVVVKGALHAFLRDWAKARFDEKEPEVQLKAEEAVAAPVVDEEAAIGSGDGIETTEAERQAHYILKGILAGTVDLKRVAMRDLKHQCAFLLDDTLRQPICKLRQKGDKLALEVFDQVDTTGGRREGREVEIGSVEDLSLHADALRAAAQGYCSSPAAEPPTAGETT